MAIWINVYTSSIKPLIKGCVDYEFDIPVCNAVVYISNIFIARGIVTEVDEKGSLLSVSS